MRWGLRPASGPPVIQASARHGSSRGVPSQPERGAGCVSAHVRIWAGPVGQPAGYRDRYADDFVLGFQYRSDAVRFQREATARLARYGLDLHPDKTRLIEFGRFAAADRKRRGQGKPETFDFLGFTHYCRRRRGGKFGLGRKPIAKRMSRKLRAIKQALKRRMHEDERETGQ